MTVMWGLVLVAVAWWLVTRLGCTHLDEAGHSMLWWSYDETAQRLRGYCPRCHGFTRGWAVRVR